MGLSIQYNTIQYKTRHVHLDVSSNHTIPRPDAPHYITRCGRTSDWTWKVEVRLQQQTDAHFWERTHDYVGKSSTRTATTQSSLVVEHNCKLGWRDWRITRFIHAADSLISFLNSVCSFQNSFTPWFGYVVFQSSEEHLKPAASVHAHTHSHVFFLS